jgi:hypothetical protein
MAIVSVATAPLVLARSVSRQAAEAEFAEWYRVPYGCELVYDAGRWLVVERIEIETSSRPLDVAAVDKAPP